MTDEERTDELIQKAKESYKIYSEDKCVDSYEGCQYIDGYCNGYEQGYEDCRHYAHNYYKPKWHDLRKAPNDLPEEGIEVLVLYSNTYGDGRYIVNKHTLNYELAQYINDEEDTSEWYWVETGTDYDIQKVIAWCELPKFEE